MPFPAFLCLTITLSTQTVCGWVKFSGAFARNIRNHFTSCVSTGGPNVLAANPFCMAVYLTFRIRFVALRNARAHRFHVVYVLFWPLLYRYCRCGNCIACAAWKCQNRCSIVMHMSSVDFTQRFTASQRANGHVGEKETCSCSLVHCVRTVGCDVRVVAWACESTHCHSQLNISSWVRNNDLRHYHFCT